jgi:hypothetical protein
MERQADVSVWKCAHQERQLESARFRWRPLLSANLPTFRFLGCRLSSVLREFTAPHREAPFSPWFSRLARSSDDATLAFAIDQFPFAFSEAGFRFCAFVSAVGCRCLSGRSQPRMHLPPTQRIRRLSSANRNASQCHITCRKACVPPTPGPQYWVTKQCRRFAGDNRNSMHGPGRTGIRRGAARGCHALTSAETIVMNLNHCP